MTMRVASLLVAACLWHGAAEGGLTEEACEARAQRLAAEAEGNAAQLQAAEKLFRSLESELAQLRTENLALSQGVGVANASEVASGVAASATAALEEGKTALDVTYEIFARVLSKMLAATDIDDTVADYTTNVMDKVTSVDYSEYVTNLTQHELYLTHVAPSVSPVLEATQVYTDAAKEAYSSACKALNDTVAETLPSMMTGASEALRTRVSGMLEPLFGIVAWAAPDHAKFLPSSFGDRVLIILILALIGHECFLATRFALRITYAVLRMAIRLPLTVFSWWFWIATGFYCCGLCRRRSAKPLAQEAKKQGEKATVEEVTKLLESSKKKGKVEAAVQLLLSFTGEGKVLGGEKLPQNIHGKQLDKDVLKKAVKTFKDLDASKLGL